ncbi:DUF3578 domain-containing protein [Streptomyces sp. NPDC051907]|uniref:MrcB family domain-containing protein n=1 Tax=Streptomyces sp. NPDC051907 TaxID=3155284 RepID=UPI00342A1B12
MDIRDLLGEVAKTYNKAAGTARGVPAQDLLRAVGRDHELPLPSGFVARGYGGQGNATSTPWVGVFDPDVSEDPKQGLYLAYLFSAELSAVTLTLQQGMTLLEERFQAKRDLCAHLRDRARVLRGALPERLATGWRQPLALGASGWRPVTYEAGSVVARRYEIADMPREEELRDDLSQAASLLQRAATAERLWWLEGRGREMELEYPSDRHVGSVSLDGFRPKDSSDYIANIAARQQIKKRSHEALIAAFGQYVADRGYVPTTVGVHPKDLVLHRATAGAGREEWLVEAKVVAKGNPTSAVRGAVGQLLEYRHFLYRERDMPLPRLLGLFTEDIGVYASYLEDHDIASVWQAQDGQGWDGSAGAVASGLVGVGR